MSLADAISDYAFNIAVSPDSRHVVFLGDRSGDAVYELYSLTIGSSQPVQLNGVSAPAEVQIPFTITPDNRYVLYQPGVTADLYRAPIGGGSSIRLATGVRDYTVSQDGQWVVFRSSSDPAYLRRVRIDGNEGSRVGVAPTRPQLYGISPDSRRIVFAPAGGVSGTSATALLSAPLGGGGATTLWSGAGAQSVVDFQISPDSRRVVFRWYDNRFGNELDSVPIGGGETAILYLPYSSRDVYSNYQISSDSRTVLFLVSWSTSYRQLFGAPIDLPQQAQPRPLSEYQYNVSAFTIAPNSSRAAFVANPVGSSSYALYSVPLGGGVKPLSPATSSPIDFKFTPDSNRVVFGADLLNQQARQSYSVPASGGTPIPLSVSQPNDQGLVYFRISPNGSGVVSAVGPNAGSSNATVDHLYTAPPDGTDSPPDVKNTLAGSASIASFDFTPDSSYVVFTADRNGDGRPELYVTGASQVMNYPVPRPFEGQPFYIPLASG